MNLTTPLSVQKLQQALHDRAKGSPNFRFYALYDKVYRKDILAFAYECCKANGGAAGVDGQNFEQVEEYGVERWLDELTQDLKSRTYRPSPVRRVNAPQAPLHFVAIFQTARLDGLRQALEGTLHASGEAIPDGFLFFLAACRATQNVSLLALWNRHLFHFHIGPHLSPVLFQQLLFKLLHLAA